MLISKQVMDSSKEILVQCSLPEIVNIENYRQATDACKLLKDRAALLEGFRRVKTDPLLAKQKEIKAEFDKFIVPLEDLVHDIKAKMSRFIEAEQKRKDEEQRLLEEKAKADNPTSSELIVDVVNDIRSQKGGDASSNARKVWSFQVMDAELVPRSLCEPDDKKIRAAIALGERNIPGVKIFQETKISIR